MAALAEGTDVEVAFQSKGFRQKWELPGFPVNFRVALRKSGAYLVNAILQIAIPVSELPKHARLTVIGVAKGAR